jgi:hypothetical protein
VDFRPWTYFDALGVLAAEGYNQGVQVLVSAAGSWRVGALTERIGTVLRVITTTAVVLAVAFCRADTLTLHTGGVVRGRVSDSVFVFGSKPVSPDKVVSRANGEAARTITITTLTGGRLVLDASQVRTVTHRPLLLEEYEVRKQHTPEEVDSLWKLAEWCRNRGLKPQREDVLRRILVYDPDNVQARQGLGQSRHDGQWRTHDEEMRSRGFVKYEGRYVAVQEVEILKKLHSRRRVEQDWTERIRSWSYALSSIDPEKRRRGRTQLLKISDPNAIPALNKILRTSEDEERRSLYVKILSRIPGLGSVPFLVEQSLFDVSKAVRVDAQDTITPQLRDSACPLYSRALRNPDNEVVRRAGRMLEKIGDESVVSALIEAIATTHQVPVNVVDNSNTYSFGGRNGKADPNVIPLPPDVAGKLAAGQYPNGVTINTPDNMPEIGPRMRTVMVDREFRNPEVLSALESLTKQSFGYDKDQWRRWWAARTTMGGTRLSNANAPGSSAPSSTAPSAP